MKGEDGQHAPQLTRPQREGAALVAEGLSNREIAGPVLLSEPWGAHHFGEAVLTQTERSGGGLMAVRPSARVGRCEQPV